MPWVSLKNGSDNMKRPSQKQRILDRLLMGDRITQEDCDRMHPKIKRLAARIGEIKETKDSSGRFYQVDDRRIKTPGGASVSEYWLRFTGGNQAALFGTPDRGRPE